MKHMKHNTLLLFPECNTMIRKKLFQCVQLCKINRHCAYVQISLWPITQYFIVC